MEIQRCQVPDPPATALPGGRRPGGATAEEAERACAIAGAVAETILGGPRANRRPRAVAFARQVAMYLAHVGFGVSMAAVGKAFGRDRTTVIHACHVIEDRRDDRDFDAFLDHLERAAGALSAGDRINRLTRED